MEVTFSFEWSDDFKRWDFPMYIPSKGATEIISWIGADIDSCGSDAPQRMIQRLRGIQEGKEKKGYIGTGNAHSMMAFDDSMYLRCEFDEELKVILPIDEAIKALEGFARFKSGDWKSPNYQPEPFTVKYDYEGADAYARYEASGSPAGLTAEDIAENTRKIGQKGLGSI